MWKEAQNVRRRHSERSWCPINPDTELKLTSSTMFIADFNDVGDICMVNGILRKHKYHQILQRRALTSGEKLCGRWFINTFLTCVEMRRRCESQVYNFVLTVFLHQSPEVYLIPYW